MNPFRTNPMRRVLLGTVATVSGVTALLALKPHTQTAVALPQTAASPTTPSAGASSPASASPSASSSTKSTKGTKGTKGTTTTKTVTGDTIQTRYGPVQVQITLKAGKLSAVNVLQVPQDNPRDAEIAQYSVPVLTQEALAAQSASINSVSGATYTSQGYISSLQSALDKSGN
ncbi:FMN-binding protein [Actinacidiphila soli]|uniref:FMN-binding protein n=1 Tax=Actinacidiphila soli TaxID=2487275 RepID=UPI000FCA6187|nr:FMN-binding protein [Actinacidiphila soli]